MVLGLVGAAGEMAWQAVHQSAVAAACILSAVRVGLLGFGPSYKTPSPGSPRVKPRKPSPRAATPAPLSSGGGVMPQQEGKIAEEEREASPRSVFSLPPLSAPESKTPATKAAVSPAAEEKDEPYHLHHPSLHQPTYEGLGGGLAAKPEMTPRLQSGRVLSQRGGTSPGGPKQVVKCSVM